MVFVSKSSTRPSAIQRATTVRYHRSDTTIVPEPVMSSPIFSAMTPANIYPDPGAATPVFSTNSSDTTDPEQSLATPIVTSEPPTAANHPEPGVETPIFSDEDFPAMKSSPVFVEPCPPALPVEPVVPVVAPFPSLALTEEETGRIPFYTLSVTDQNVTFFVASSEKLIQKSRHEVSLPTIDKGLIYHVSALTYSWMGEITNPLCRRKYTERSAFICPNIDAYSEVILPSLILGCRVRDYKQRCATVTQLGDLVLSMPAQGGWMESLKLKTASGQAFNVDVKSVEKEETERRWIVTCYTPKDLPSDVSQGCQLEIVKGAATQSPVTTALYQFYSNKKSAAAMSIDNRKMLSCLYGRPAHREHPAVALAELSIRLRKGGAVLQLNPEQAEAVARYNNSAVPAFVIEAPPGSGKTMTAAAMAVSYKGEGVQLFLSTANVPVMNMALALDKLNYGMRSPIHLASSEYEEKLMEEDYSPFSSLSLAKNQKALTRRLQQLERHMPSDEKKRQTLINDMRRGSGPILEEAHDIYFATVDSILNRLFKPNKGGHHQADDVKDLLEKDVQRVVIDEASQLTESALNALILAFPKAQIVLIGDPRQLAPFRYKRGDVVSELSARSALDVVKDKRNLPVIKLRKVYRAEPSLIAHYSDVFYGGALVSCKSASDSNPISCFLARGGGSRCLFWKVNNGYCKQEGTSKINYREVNALNHIIETLHRYSNIEKKDVLIISYYEAQRKAAQERLPEGYEVLTVDSAQGREKKVVIVLTTRTSVPSDPDEDFFNSAKRCNVAVSRHQEALIVLGHPTIASAPNWTEVLSPAYFHHVEDNSGARAGSA